MPFDVGAMPGEKERNGREESTFLDASTQLYKRLCPSVGPSVGPFMGPTVRLFSNITEMET